MPNQLELLELLELVQLLQLLAQVQLLNWQVVQDQQHGVQHLHQAARISSSLAVQCS
jgi:hypothetical protein